MLIKELSMHRRFSPALLTAAVLISAANLAYSATTPAPASPAVAGGGAQSGPDPLDVPPADVDGFVASFLATFGGQSTKQVVVTVTPTSSSTTSQLPQTPVGPVSVFGSRTPT